MTATTWGRMGDDWCRITREGHFALLKPYLLGWELHVRTRTDVWEADLEPVAPKAAQREADRLIAQWQKEAA